MTTALNLTMPLKLVLTASRVPRARFSLPALLAPLLCLAAACAVSDDVEAACTPRPGVGCTILRPVGWNVLGTGCVERPITSIFRGDQQTYTAFAVPGPLFGSGSTTLLCDGGCLKTIAKTCRRSGGSEP